MSLTKYESDACSLMPLFCHFRVFRHFFPNSGTLTNRCSVCSKSVTQNSLKSTFWNTFQHIRQRFKRVMGRPGLQICSLHFEIQFDLRFQIIQAFSTKKFGFISSVFQLIFKISANRFILFKSKILLQITLERVTNLEELLGKIAENITEIVNDPNTNTTESEMKVYIRVSP